MLAAWAAPQAVPGPLFSVLIKENSLTTCPLAQGGSYVRKAPPPVEVGRGRGNLDAVNGPGRVMRGAG